MTPPRLAGARAALDTALGDAGAVDLSWLSPEDQRDAWTLGDDALRYVARLIALVRPRRVLEFGSGVSTRVMAAACAGLDEPATVVSLETDPVYERRTRLALAGDATDVARVELTHLVARRWYGRNLPVYDLPVSVLQGPAPELVLVDGPPLPLGGREGSLFQAIHLAGEGTLVVLDDADRTSEQTALARAEETFTAAVDVVRLTGFAKGLAVVVVHHPVGRPAMPPVPAP